MDNPTQHTPEHPSASEERKGDSSFLPVVLAAGVALIVILALAVFFIKGTGKKILPKTPDPHPTSQIVPAAPIPSSRALHSGQAA
jgi:hypothetical protein